jgi:hypothetical protein
MIGILSIQLIVANNTSETITDEEAWELAEKVVVPIGEDVSEENVSYSKSISWRLQYFDMVLVRITLKTPYESFNENDAYGEKLRDGILEDLGSDIELYSTNIKGWIFHAHITKEGLSQLIDNPNVISVIDLDIKTFDSFKYLLKFMDISEGGVYYSKSLPERFNSDENVTVWITFLDKSGAFETNDNFDEYIAKKRAWLSVQRENLLKNFSKSDYNLIDSHDGLRGGISKEFFYELLNNSEIIEYIEDTTNMPPVHGNENNDLIAEKIAEKDKNINFWIFGAILITLIALIIIIFKRRSKKLYKLQAF